MNKVSEYTHAEGRSVSTEKQRAWAVSAVAEQAICYI